MVAHNRVVSEPRYLSKHALIWFNCIIFATALMVCACTRNRVPPPSAPPSAEAAATAQASSDPDGKAPPADPAAERAKRLTPVTQTTPPPAKISIPLLGPEGFDKDGYPTQYVDRLALRSLLWAKRYVELTKHMEFFQEKFEGNPRYEYWILDAADAFASAEAALRPFLDAWVEAVPNSFAAYLARGIHWVDVGYTSRGSRYASKTPDEDFASMEQALGHAIADLDRALAINPKLVAALRQKIKIEMASSGARGLAGTIKQILKICPACFQVRVTTIFAMTPRWGGSYDAMERFANSADVALNPRFKFLRGYIDLDKADLLSADDKNDEALAAIQQACALGEFWEFFKERADIQIHGKHYTEALADLERANALRPGSPQVMVSRMKANYYLQRREAAGQDLSAIVRMDPTNSTARNYFDSIIEGMNYEGWQHASAGRLADALRVYDLAVDLAPGNRELQGRRFTILVGKAKPDEQTMKQAELRVQANPDDQLTVRQLDYLISYTSRDFNRILELWNSYIQRHPDDARAYLERGGTLHHLAKQQESLADLQKACQLGLNEGCQLLKRVGPK